MALHPDFLTRPLAHRGLHDRPKGVPENSMAAFRAAIANGYGIELDVQGTADAQAMVFHDDNLDRLTAQTGPVRGKTAAALGLIKLRDSAEKIPTLAEVLALVDGQVPLLVEIKDQDGQLGANTGQLERATALALAHYDGPVAVMSFNPHAMAIVREHAPDLSIGLVTCDFISGREWRQISPERLESLNEIANFDRLGASFISHDRADLERPRITQLKQAGAAILCWTIRSKKQESEARKIADNITFEGYLA